MYNPLPDSGEPALKFSSHAGASTCMRSVRDHCIGRPQAILPLVTETSLPLSGLSGDTHKSTLNPEP